MSKVVFVGNVPYNFGEAELIDVFKSVGQVVAFRLVFDRDTGKPKGYGFCEFADNATALSAVRNLHGQELNGRPLRVDLADSDPFLEGKTTVKGELMDGGDDNRDYRSAASQNPKDFLAGLPPGVPVAPGTNALDAISHTLGSMNPATLMEVLAQVKAFVINHPEQARTLLVSQPQLAYALFQALLLNNIVDTAVLQRMLHATTPSVPVSAVPTQQNMPPPPIPQAYPPAPIPQAYAPPPQNPAYPPYGQPGPPPPQPYSAPPAAYGAYPARPPPTMGMPGMGPPPGAMFGMGAPRPGYYPPPQPGPPILVPALGVEPTLPAVKAEESPAVSVPPAAQQVLDEEHQNVLRRVLSMTPEEVNALPPTDRDAITQIRNQFLSANAATAAVGS